ncbi:MAG: hypothetical protein V1907_00070 [Candidatus Kerfeldbacteria bacterium]
MTHEIISTPNEQPKTTTARKAMYLALAAIVAIPFLGTFAGAIRPMIDRKFNENVGAGVGITVGIVILALSVSALVMSIRAYRQGDRSREMWFGLIPAILVTAFWVLMLIGEFVFPH